MAKQPVNKKGLDEDSFLIQICFCCSPCPEVLVFELKENSARLSWRGVKIPQ